MASADTPDHEVHDGSRRARTLQIICTSLTVKTVKKLSETVSFGAKLPPALAYIQRQQTKGEERKPPKPCEGGEMVLPTLNHQARGGGGGGDGKGMGGDMTT